MPNRPLTYTRPLIAAIVLLLAGLIPTWQGAPSARADALAAPTMTTVELSAAQDAFTSSSSAGQNFGASQLFMKLPDSHHVFVQFDLNVLPADATIDAAELRLEITRVDGPNDVEVARADAAWDEATITWDTEPAITSGGPIQTIDATGVAGWDVKAAVAAWHGGANNHGFALRGQGENLIVAHAKEGGVAPKLIVTYTIPDDPNPRPDLGDAPDSTNHHGVSNSAYVGVPGNFPTVWEVPASEPAGPRHKNITLEGWLGDYISRENEADQGPDQDGPNNILRAAGGAIADISDNDRGDDGWRNRDVKFFDCEAQILTVRVSKAANATKNRMFLNVWFDGDRDGTWTGEQPCPQAGGFNQPGYEWIVQNFSVDMTAIPAGGSLDLPVPTELVMNSTPGQRHWMRFTLSEERAVQAPGQLADGRGPHPTSAFPAFEYGETEDIRYAPQPAGEDGQLTVQKRVLATDGGPVANPVPYADSVIYEILLKHEGGSQPIQAQIRDLLPYPLHLNRQMDDDGHLYLIAVEGTPGNVTPLAAALDYNLNADGRITQQVAWDGTLAPNAQVKLSFEVHVHPLCGAGENTQTIRNVAQARPKGGTPTEAVAEFEAACPGYSARDISVTRQIVESDGNPIDTGNVHASSQDATEAARLSLRKWSIKTDFTNLSNSKLTVGTTLGWVGCLTCTVQAAGTNAINMSPQRVERDSLTLEPNETKSLIHTLDIDEFLVALGGQPDLDSDDITLESTLHYCLLNDVMDGCLTPGDFPTQVSEADPVLEADPVPYTIVRSDLGDAPDSSNHAGANMAAYAGIQANYPTVFDINTGAPEGPRHRYPQPFHLGPAVTLEADADVGPDQDATNNIIPAANTPNLDGADDGTNLNQWNFANCQTTTLPIEIFISPAAAQKLADSGGYLNVWLDSNRDGDWADGFTCQGPTGNSADVVEHIIIDFPVDVAALGAGLHTLNVPTNRVPWPAAQAESKTWVRITLSERESNKTLSFGSVEKYGDGRGYPVPFRTGETEDYPFFPNGAVNPDGGPDVEIRLSGIRQPVSTTDSITDSMMDRAAAAQAGINQRIQQFRFKLDYGNVGTQEANGALLEFQLPEKLQDGNLTVLQSPGIAASSFMAKPGGILQVELPELKAGHFGTIVLGWYGCLTCTVQSASVDALVNISAVVTLEGDKNAANNASQYEWESGAPLFAPTVRFQAPHGGTASQYATCQESIELVGSGYTAGEQLKILVDGQESGDATTDGSGGFSFLLPIDAGRHMVEVCAAESANMAGVNAADVNHRHVCQTLRILQDSGLLIDPMSIVLKDAQGNSLQPEGQMTFPYFNPVTLPGLGKYEMQVNSCPNAELESVAAALGDQFIKATPLGADDCTPKGSDACGPWSMTLNLIDSVQAASVTADQSLQLIVDGNGSQTTYASSLAVAAAGKVSDVSTAAAVADATVTVLAPTSDDADVVYLPWDATATGQSNPQTTDGSGQYTLALPDGTYRISVQKAGYQRYVSQDVEVINGSIAQEIGLTPAISDDANHVIQITEAGFSPSLLTVTRGAIVAFVNVDLADHSTIEAGWDSGLLSAGESFKVQIDGIGTYSYRDGTSASNIGSIVVAENVPDSLGGNETLFLPLVTR